MSSSTTDATTVAEIAALEAEYAKMEAQQAVLRSALERLQSDEDCLQAALSASRAPEPATVRTKEADAVKRLEAALMADDSSSSSSAENDDDGADLEAMSFGSLPPAAT